MGSTPTSRIVKVYGPYESSDKNGRKQVIVKYSCGKTATHAYARWLWIQEHGEIPDGYHVHHINGDPSDDRLENYALMPHGDHNREHAVPAEIYEGVCVVCKSVFTKSMRDVRGNRKKNRKGPYCSRSCAGKASAMFQHHGVTYE